MGRSTVAVIGGGIAGLSLAARAAEEFQVTVLEAESQPAYHSSGRSAAVAIECYENELVRELTLPGMSHHRAHGAKRLGCMSVADEEHLDELDAFERRWRGLSASLEEISPAEALALVPILRPEATTRVVIERDALSLDAHQLIEGFRKQLLAAGGALLTNARVISIQRIERGWLLVWDGGRLEADVLVNAAGAWGDGIAELAGVAPVGLAPKRRSALLVDMGRDVSAWPLVHRIEGGLYFKPEAGQLMVSPADVTPSPPCDVQPDELDIALAVDRFQAMTTAEVGRIEHRWAGLRSFLPDDVPAVGFDPAADGFFWLVGQGGFGIQTAPGLSQVAADLLAGRDHRLAAALNPARLRQVGASQRP